MFHFVKLRRNRGKRKTFFVFEVFYHYICIHEKRNAMTQKERIVEQAMQMFVRQGIKSVRMDDIAHSLGVSKRTLYELFGDKEELLTLSVVRYFESRRQRNSEIAAKAANVLEALFIVLNEILDSSAAADRLLGNLKKFYPTVYEKVMQEGRESNYLCFREMLEKGIAEGLFVSDFNLDLSIAMLYYTATGMISHSKEIVPAGMTEREAFVQIVSNFFRGISTARGLELMDAYKRRYDLAKTGARNSTNEQ